MANTINSSSSADDCLQQARLAADQGNYGAVVDWLREAVRMEPYHLHANAHLAWLHGQNGEYRQALKPLLRTALRRPWMLETYPRFLQNLWLALRKELFARKKKSSLLSLVYRFAHNAAWKASERATRYLEGSRKEEPVVAQWIRHNQNLKSRHPINEYEYYKVSEIDFVARHIAPGSRVLDLGSGRSAFPSFLTQRGCEVTVAELELPCLRMQKQISDQEGLSNLQVTSGNFLYLPFSDAAFDAVSIISSIEHVPGDGDVQTVKELARVLKPGGVLLITVPAGPQAQEHWTTHTIGHVYQESSQQGAGGYLRVYSPETLRQRLIEPSGLMLENLKFYGETTSWGWMGLGRNFVDHRQVIHPSVFAAPLNRLFVYDISEDRLNKAHWTVGCVKLRKK